jgi:hypothetical protein
MATVSRGLGMYSMQADIETLIQKFPDKDGWTNTLPNRYTGGKIGTSYCCLHAWKKCGMNEAISIKKIQALQLVIRAWEGLKEID